MTTENLEFNNQLKNECDKITEKALTTPMNTNHLMELKEYMEKVEEKDIFVIEQKMVNSMGRLKILSEYPLIVTSAKGFNAQIFAWLTIFPKILADHKEIISQSRREAEEALKVNDIIILCKFHWIY